MANTRPSNTRRAPGGHKNSLKAFIPLADFISTVCINIGAIIFLFSAIYLVWAILAGQLDWMMSPKNVDEVDSARRLWGWIQFVNNTLMVSGVAVIIASAYKFRDHELTGPMLFFSGAFLYWGVPFFVSSTAQQMAQEVGQYCQYILDQFKGVGIWAMFSAIPFMLIAFWFRITSTRRPMPVSSEVPADKDDRVAPASVRYYCWQMGFCREYLKPYCKAFQEQKPCWRIKSGCHCDEEMLLRAMKKGPADKAGFIKQRQEHLERNVTGATPAQKRARCRQCFIYEMHQRQKYQVLSPLVFPVVGLLMAAYYNPLKNILDGMLAKVDKVMNLMSINQVHGVAGAWQGAQAIPSSSVDWIFIVCLGLVVASNLLRLVEYLIFELQI